MGVTRVLILAICVANPPAVAGERPPSYPAMTNAGADEMAKAFAFCAGQRISVELMAKRFPELKVRLVRAQGQFAIRFGAAISAIDAILLHENTKWRTSKSALLKTLREQTHSTQVSLVDAEAFLEEVQERADGTVPSPILESLLIYDPRFLRNPAEEFLSGYQKPMSLFGEKKSLGVGIRIEVPSSWRIEEGNHPHIVGKATSQNGRGNTLAMVLVLHLELPEDYVPTEQDLVELFSHDALLQMFPAAGSVQRTTLENLPAVVVEYEQTGDRLGTRMVLKGKMFMVLFKNKLVQLQCVTAVTEDNTQDLEHEYKKYSPLFQLIGNSLVIREKWTTP